MLRVDYVATPLVRPANGEHTEKPEVRQVNGLSECVELETADLQYLELTEALQSNEIAVLQAALDLQSAQFAEHRRRVGQGEVRKNLLLHVDQFVAGEPAVPEQRIVATDDHVEYLAIVLVYECPHSSGNLRCGGERKMREKN